MSDERPRLVGALVGDVAASGSAATKYGLLFESLRKRFSVPDVFDASLSGRQRYLNALRVMHPDRRRWREHFSKNVAGFRFRSRNLASRVDAMEETPDCIFQLGVLFDASWNTRAVPVVVYTDYTAALSARSGYRQRSPFAPPELAEWLELERRAYESASHIFTRGRFVARSIVDDYGVAPARVTAVGGGVNLAPFPALNERPRSGPPTVLFIGKDFERKGGDLLLEAFVQVRNALPTARLILLTRGPIPGGLPQEGVEIVAPTHDRATVAALYRQADVFVLPARLETWGDVLIEAMAFGLPCVGVKTDGIPEIIIDGETGLVVDPDPEALATGLSRLLRDEVLSRRLGAAARQLAQTQYTWDAVVDRMYPGITAATALA